jgi:uncharacterized caspase-like protein
VGINDYREITPLQKAVGDAEALKVTLERLGFSVDLVLNADRREFNCAVSAFQTSLDPGDTALVHFSGHGVEIDGQNYLLAADIPKPQSGQQDFIKSEAMSLGDLMQRIASSGAGTRIFIIDACRDNPFAGSGGRGLGGTRGLAVSMRLLEPSFSIRPDISRRRSTALTTRTRSPPRSIRASSPRSSLSRASSLPTLQEK